MATCHLSAGRGRFRAHPVRIPDRRGDCIAARRVGRLADAALPRASAARPVAVRLDAVCWFLAVGVLSLGSATAIGFAAPLFTTLLSIVILKEKVGIHRWSALIVGFVGVLIITHPGAGTLTYGALFALVNAVLTSTVAIAIRRMSMTESTETLTLYQMSMMTLCTAGLLMLGFRAPHLRDTLMLALAGVGNGIAQFWWTRAPSLAAPSAVVPFNYCR
jgi:drug/metabolite transporter (DMT)-like permease